LQGRSRIGSVDSAEFDGILGASDECQDVIRQDEEVREISSCLGAAKLGTLTSASFPKEHLTLLTVVTCPFCQSTRKRTSIPVRSEGSPAATIM
jgi:hypothetical protein